MVIVCANYLDMQLGQAPISSANFRRTYAHLYREQLLGFFSRHFLLPVLMSGYFDHWRYGTGLNTTVTLRYKDIRQSMPEMKSAFWIILVNLEQRNITLHHSPVTCYLGYTLMTLLG